MNTWRAGCTRSCTSGSEGGPGKPTSRNADRAPWSDPYTYVPTWSGFAYPGVGDRRLFAVRRRLAGLQQPTNRPGAGRSRTSTLGPATGHGRSRPAAGSSLREPGQYLSIRYTYRLAEAGISPSVGSVGDSYDNALAESVIGLYKTELIRQSGPWRDRDQVEYATLEYVDWFNHRRLLEPIGNIPPAEKEDNYHRQQKRVQLAGLK